MTALQPVEFDDGSLLDLDAVAVDVDLPPWLARRAGEAVRLLVAIAAAVDAAQALDQHRRALVDDHHAEPTPTPTPTPAPVPARAVVFGCPHCGQEFAAADGLLGHIGAEHRVDKPPRPRSGPVTCDGCGREFSRAQGLGRHRPFCTGQKPEVRRCRECGCTDENCAGCIERTGQPCAWVDDDLCSACVPAGGAPPAPASEQVEKPEPAPTHSETHTRNRSGPGGVVLLPAGLCNCGHAPRHHEDRTGMCIVGDCDCAEYEGP